MQKTYESEFPKKPMGNYSKSKVKIKKCPKMKALNLFEKHTQGSSGEEVKELFPIGKANEWQWIKGVVDSGAVDSVAHPSMCPQYPGTPSEDSKAGEGYTSASTDFLPNLGEQVLPVQTVDGRDTCISYQLADVSKP